MKKILLLITLLIAPRLSFGQTTYGRIVTDSIAPTQIITITGATPDISTGNVFKTNNSSLTTITNLLNGTVGKQITIICGDANTTIANNANIVTSSGTNFTCAINQSISFIYDDSQVKWVQSGSVSGGGGGGGTPGAPNQSVQCNNSGSFGPCNATDSGTLFSINEDMQFKGINPYVDIRKYGARAVSTVPSTTATITSGSPNATLAAASTFQNGDGAMFFGAGATNTMTTPSTPTVVSRLATGSIRGKSTTNANAGATTYQYQIIAQDKAGAITAASTAGTTTTGLATLGRVPVTITSISRANNIESFVMSAPTDLVVGAAFYVDSSSDTTFNTAHVVTTRTDSTHFTSATLLDTRNGATTSATGGTVSYYNCNHVTWPAVTGAFIYYIYGRTSGSNVYLGFSFPGDPYFDDYGTTFMGSPFRPSWVPNTPPGSATNDPLVTTIVSGAGTTSVVLANNAINSITGSTFIFDDVPALMAAITAAGGAPVYFPYVSGSFVFNSYLQESGPIVFRHEGSITINNTWEFSAAPNWNANAGGAANTTPQFNRGYYQNVTCTFSPCIYISGGVGGEFQGMFFSNNNDQALVMLEDGSFPASNLHRMGFSTGNGGLNADYMGIGYMARGAALISMNDVIFDSTLNNSTTPLGFYAPSLYLRGDLAGTNFGATGDIKDVRFTPKGMAVEETTPFGGFALYAQRMYTQGGRTPMFTVQSSVGCCLGGAWTIGTVTMDTTFAPVVANLGGGNAIAFTFFDINSAAVAIAGSPLLGALTNAGGANSHNIIGANFFDNHVAVLGQGSIQYGTTSTVGAPGTSVGAGGSVAVGTQSYTVQFTDINNSYGPQSAAGIAVTTGGNQTVTITKPTTPAGMVGWAIYRNGARIQTGGNCFFAPVSVTTSIDDGLGLCGNSVAANTAGVSMISGVGLSSPSLKLIDHGFTASSDFGAGLTANRVYTDPDATGTRCISTSCNVNAVAVGGDTAFSSSPRSVPPIFVPGALTATWTQASWTLDKAITVTRVQSALKTVPSGCGTNAIIRISDGTNNVNLTLTAATNDSGVISQNFAANAVLTVSVQTAAATCTVAPGDANVMIQYRMQ